MIKYYCIKQHDITDCGAACIATISKQYGLKKSISKIREIAGTDKAGTNALGLVKAAQQLGFDAKGVRGTAEDFSDKIPLPAIAHLVKDDVLHYVVVHKVGKKKITIADPAEGIVKYSHEDFLKIWSGVLILLAPNENFVKKDETQGLFSPFFLSPLSP